MVQFPCQYLPGLCRDIDLAVSSPLLQTWVFLAAIIFARENTEKQMFRWPPHLHQPPFSHPLHLLLVCLPSTPSLHRSPPSPSRLQTKADYHIHEAARWQMKAIAKERTKPILYRAFITYRSYFHLQLFSRSLRWSFTSLTAFTLLFSLSFSLLCLSAACLYEGTKIDWCVCVWERVCTSWHW